nr:splicing factor 3B subunit 1-like isoform X2 [Aedes albopictus]
MDNIPRTHEDIEAQIRDIQTKKKEISAEAAKDKGVGLLESGYYDSELYDGSAGKGKYEGYVTSIAPNDDVDEDEDDGIPMGRGNRPAGYTAPAALLNDVAQPDTDYDPFADRRRPTVGEKEDEYRQKRRRLVISPERIDPFADGTRQIPTLLKATT